MTFSSQTVRLRYRAPYDWDAILGYLRPRAIDGVERVDGEGDAARYTRTIASDGARGTLELAHEPARDSVAVTLRLAPAAPMAGSEARATAPRASGSEVHAASLASGSEVRATSAPRASGSIAPAAALLAAPILARVRHVLDLDADVAVITAHLARDPLLATLVARRPGLRVPGGWDGFELAVRAVLGQQVTVVAARRLAGQLVALCGTRANVPGSSAPPAPDAAFLGAAPADVLDAAAGSPRRSLAFPTAAQVADADLSALGMPSARRETLRAIARAALADPQLFARASSVDATVERLRAIRGVGDWTAHYIALRAAREPDAFPASDIGLLRAVAEGGARPTPRALLARAERWRPWRAYAAQHLWAADAAR